MFFIFIAFLKGRKVRIRIPFCLKAEKYVPEIVQEEAGG